MDNLKLSVAMELITTPYYLVVGDIDVEIIDFRNITQINVEDKICLTLLYHIHQKIKKELYLS